MRNPSVVRFITLKNEDQVKSAAEATAQRGLLLQIMVERPRVLLSLCFFRNIRLIWVVP